MTKNPFFNAICAAGYVALIVSTLFYGSSLVPEGESIIFPIAILSLFVLSAAIMGYIFLFNPLVLFFEGNKKEAVELFLRTTLYFGGITLLFICILIVSARFF